MKTPTLIVRLGGLYLLANCVIGLTQLQKMHASIPGMVVQQNGQLWDFKFYAWLGLILGLGATIFAGPLARFLTLDSEQRTGAPDYSEILLGRRD